MPCPHSVKKTLFFSDFCFVASPSPNSVPICFPPQARRRGRHHHEALRHEQQHDLRAQPQAPFASNIRKELARETNIGPYRLKTKQENTKTIISWDCPGLSQPFAEISREFYLCVSFFRQKRQHINNFDPHPLLGQSRKILYV